ncbi:hypothetical protein, partial [Klebsiella pneumoniae]|uniref:hypothetical protein n=1 Tax=Klebsiella pneumoniae TaxID=573 RepID=UPI003EF3C5DF
QNDVTLKMPAFEWVHVQLHQQKGMISLSPPTICNSALTDTSISSLLLPGINAFTRCRSLTSIALSGSRIVTANQTDS